MNPAWLVFVALATQAPAEAPAGRQRIVDVQIAAALVADVLPKKDVAELRPLLSMTMTGEVSASVAIRADVAVQVLAANRGRFDHAAIVEVRDVWFEARRGPADLRVGYGRLAWGRLDEIAPTDVINPIDAARFLLEGRAEARLAVPFVRGRIAGSERVSVEGIVVPAFRRGTFDRLAETTSPFNLVTDALPAGVVPTVPNRVHDAPSIALSNVSGGARVQATVGRLDVAGVVYRGFDGLGPITSEIGPYGPAGSVALRAVEHHPRFTIVGADFETVAGGWAWRGEVASFIDRTFAARTSAGLVEGRSLDAGLGFDRRFGEFRVFGSVIAHRESSDRDPGVDRADVNLVGSIERSWGRDRYLGRAFVVLNPDDRAAFIRGLIVWRAQDQLAFELSGGAFLGTSDDAIGRFRERDFVLAKVRAWF